MSHPKKEYRKRKIAKLRALTIGSPEQLGLGICLFYPLRCFLANICAAMARRVCILP